MKQTLEKINQVLNAIPRRYFNITFWILIAVSMLQYLLYRYAPSLDGPQHLYNAYVLKDLLLNRGIIPEYIAVNPSPVGYWTTQLLLGMFTFFLPPWLAEKVLLLGYVVCFVLAYRYFLGGLKTGFNRYAQYLVFPFIFSYYILTGNYAFSYGIALFFLAFGYWNRISSAVTFTGALKFSFLLLLLYFTHVVVFTFFAISFALYYVFESLQDLHPGQEERITLRDVITRTVYTLAAFIPPAVPWIISTRSVVALQSGLASGGEGAAVLLDQMFRIRSLIGFHHGIESVATIPLFLMLMIIFLTILLGWIYDLELGKIKPKNLLLRKSNLYLLLAMAFFVLYMVNPDRFMAGNLTGRAGLFFFILLIMWIPFNRLPGLLNVVMVAVILFVVVYNQAIMPGFYAPQNEVIKELQELDVYMEKHATVWPLKESDNWLHRNYHLYIGLDKHLVNLENPQCYGPFPLIWNREHLPAMFAGEQQLKYYGIGVMDSGQGEIRQVDYITVFYHQQVLEHHDFSDWLEVLENDYELVYISGQGDAALYRKVGK